MTVLPSGISSLAAWYENGTGITPGSTFTWSDSSGNGFNATQSTAAKQPTVNSTDSHYNNLKTLSFASASSQFLANTSSPSLGTCSCLVIGNTDGTATNQSYCGSDSGAGIKVFNGASLTRIDSSAGTTIGKTIQSASAANPHICIAIFNGASSAVYWDTSTASSGNAGSNTGTGNEIGASASGTNPLNGKILEVAWWTKALSTTEVGEMLNYAYTLIGWTATIKGQATQVSAMNVARAMTAAIIARATVADTLGVRRALSDVLLGTATMVDAVKVARAMTTGVGGAATVVDKAVVARALATAIAPRVTVADALAVNRALAEQIGGRGLVADALQI